MEVIFTLNGKASQVFKLIALKAKLQGYKTLGELLQIE